MRVIVQVPRVPRVPRWLAIVGTLAAVSAFWYAFVCAMLAL